VAVWAAKAPSRAGCSDVPEKDVSVSPYRRKACIIAIWKPYQRALFWEKKQQQKKPPQTKTPPSRRLSMR